MANDDELKQELKELLRRYEANFAAAHQGLSHHKEAINTTHRN
jgi:hypothetical protein